MLCPPPPATLRNSFAISCLAPRFLHLSAHFRSLEGKIGLGYITSLGVILMSVIAPDHPPQNSQIKDLKL